MWERKYLPRNRGLQADVFSDAMKKAAGASPVIIDKLKHGGVPETPGTDIADPYASILKPKNVPVWDHHQPLQQKKLFIWGRISTRNQIRLDYTPTLRVEN